MNLKVLIVTLTMFVVFGLFFFRSKVFAKSPSINNGTPADDKARKVSSEVKSYTTSATKRLEPNAPLAWAQVPATRPVVAAPGTPGYDDSTYIMVDTSKKRQSIVGFGGAFTDAACYMFDQMAVADRGKLFKNLFDPNQLNLTFCRTCIGSSDYATHMYSYNEGEPDPEMKRFSIDHDRKYILPMLREARAVNPDIFLYSSPWSPPGWMKSNKSMYGGNMQRQYMGAYALYFSRFLQDYAKEGVPVQAVTVQHEVDPDQDGRMPACTWPQEYEVDFVRYFLGPQLKKDGLKTSIWIIDHNYNLWGRALASLEADGLRDHVDGIAWHGYVGDAGAMSKVHDAYPDTHMYWTEGGPDYTDPNYSKDWVKWSRTFTGNLRNWCRGITVWNLALDEAGRPNIGPFPCGGLVTINSQTKAVSYSGQYHAIGHFSRFVKRDAVVVDSVGNKDAEVSHVAFVNPDGEKVLVLTNGGANAQTVKIRCDGRQIALTLDADSVTTVSWH